MVLLDGPAAHPQGVMPHGAFAAGRGVLPGAVGGDGARRERSRSRPIRRSHDPDHV